MPTPRPEDRRAVTTPFLLAILALWAGGVVRLFYLQGTGEHDTFMMAAGVVRGAQGGGAINPFCYGPKLQFLFYDLFRVATRLWAPATEGVLRAMNVMGALCSLAIPFLLLRALVVRLGDGARARLAVLLLVTSPVYFYIVSYGHPFHLALVLFLGSLLVIDLGRSKSTAAAIPLCAIAALLQAAALMIRFEQIALCGALAVGLVAVRPDRRRGDWLAALGVFAAALAGFVAGQVLLAPDLGPQETGPGFIENLRLLLRTVNAGLVQWGAAHLVAEIGPLLVLAAVWLGLRGLVERKWGALFAGAAGVGPSVLLYIGNPSPPRHFYVATIGLACFVAASVGPGWGRRLRLATPLVLAVNLAAPWAFALGAGGSASRRPVVALNVIERTDRNKLEIAAAYPFYDQVIAAAESRPVVVFGSWVHVAQIAARIVNDPTVQMGRAALPGNVKASALRRPGLELYLVETYDPRAVLAATKAFRDAGRNFACVSLVENGPAVNDLQLAIPREIFWWTA